MITIDYRARIMGITLGLSILGLSALAIDIPLRVTESAGEARAPGVLTSGIPFARGSLPKIDGLTLTRDGKAVPAQFSRTVAWDDGSVRWVLMDSQVATDANATTELVLKTTGNNPAPAHPVRVEEESDGLRLVTDKLAVTLSNKQPGLIQSLKLDGKELLTSAGKGLVIVTDDGKEVAAAPPSEIHVEQAGPLRAVVRLRGTFPGLHKGLLGYTARISVFAGARHLKAHVWLENAGADGQGKVKPEWFAFDGMAVDLGLGLGDAVTATCEGVEAEGALRVTQLCLKGDKAPYFTDENFAYTIRKGDEVLKEGERTDGVVALSGDQGTLTVAVRDFWQNYEKAIALDGQSLRLWLWPTEGQWPRPTRNLEKDNGRTVRLKGIAKADRYLLPGSVHKGHEFILDFSGRPVAATSADLVKPLFALAAPAYYAQTEALPALYAPGGIKSGNREADFKLGSWARMSRRAVDPADDHSIFAARSEYQSYSLTYFPDSSHWYGWMDFGDLSIPGRGQVSLHYDWPLLVLMEYLNNGNGEALRLGTQMIRHMVDIDQYWSDRDPPTVNRIQRGTVWPTYHANGRSGGPSAGGTWTAGMALWHMLTGEPKAKEAALRSAAGLVDAWEKINASEKYGGGTKVDMAANGWAIESFCAAYDLTADSRWLDEAMKLFDSNVMSKKSQHGPHLHAAGKSQIFGQGYKKEDQDYAHVIGPLCLLHHRSKHERVLQLLVEGCEKPFPSESYFRAPLFLAGLFAYTAVAADKPDYLKQGLEHFAVGFPESRMPPVFLPNNSTWSSDSAPMLRAGYPVRYGVWKLKGE